ncbi:lipopolysaccharide biosynthesis protein [Paenibacillus sp. NPDC058071]|uniref:lipopolysaccharide biosynthesis protein n=1 Tax=Paenibacillus sp. NPDC058071 TaxID=3346326 RepID=UPI0036DD1642
MARFEFLKRKDLIGYIAQIFASNLFILLLNTLTGIIIARFLGPEGRGEQAAMIMWPQLLSYIVTLGLPSSIIYHMKKREGNDGSLYVASLWTGLCLAALSVGAGLLLIPKWLSGYSTETVQFACWALVLVPFGLLGIMNNAVLQAREEFQLYNRMRYLPNVMTLMLLIALVTTNQVTPLHTSIAYLAPIAPATLWTTVRLLRIYRIRQKKVMASARLLTGYGIRSYGTDLAGTLSFYIDQVLVAGLLSPASLGIYLVALNLSKMLEIIQTSVVSVLFPQAASLQQEEAVRLTLKMHRISSMITIVLGFMAIALAPYALLLLYGSGFKEAIGLFRILVVHTVVSSATWTIAQAFMATGKPGRTTALKAASLLMNALLINLLVPGYGIAGAAYALLLSSVVNFAVLIVLFVRDYGVRLSSFFYCKEDFLWMRNQWRELGSKKKKMEAV